MVRKDLILQSVGVMRINKTIRQKRRAILLTHIISLKVTA